MDRDKTEQLKFNFDDSDTIDRLHAENSRLREQNLKLLAKVERLQQIIQADKKPKQSSLASTVESMNSEKINTAGVVTKDSPIEQKIACFRQYFKGREDVYAVRGIDKTGKPAYFPQRKKLGRKGGKIVWGDYLPLTDDIIKAHISEASRPVTVGLYPLLLDETCWLLAIDFDKQSWQEDTVSFLKTCHEFNIPAALERSRSGNGGHIWIFFEERISARMARMLGSALLTFTLEKRYQIGLDSYDRLFPNQDTLPKKKLGNLIALPLQRCPGKEGNSLFINANFEPYNDQWVFLSSLRKMALDEVKAIVGEAERSGDIIRVVKPTMDIEEPWNISTNRAESFQLSDPLPRKMKLVISNMLYLEKQGLSSSQINHFFRMAAFQNPEFYKAQSMRLPTFSKPRIINCSDDLPRYIALPRGCYEEVMNKLQKHQVDIEIVDERNRGTPLNVTFKGELINRQQQAVDKLLRHDNGILSAATAFGKTVVGARMIAARSVNTLILVHRTQLMKQWKEQLSIFLDIPKKEIGEVGGGKRKRLGRVDVAMLQTLYARGDVKDFIADYGHIIVDECHHISAFSFEQVLKKAKAKYVLGLTATLIRQDGHHPIVLMQCGPVRYKVDAKTQAKIRPFDHVVIPRHTDFKDDESGADIAIHNLYEKLFADQSRNDLIFDDLLKALDQGRSPILLTGRISHLEYFENRLKGFAKNVIVLRGGMSKKKMKVIQEKIHSIPDDQERVLLATGKFVGEGFDDARLDTLFLVTPISWKGTLQQYAGRLHRLYQGKREVQIYDYVDLQVPVLMKMYRKRLKGYQAMGYSEKTGLI